MREHFDCLKEAGKQKRWDNHAWSTNLLRRLQDLGKLSFESKNNGVHYIVRRGEKTVDFWATTGKFIVRGGQSGRGVRNMLKEIGLKIRIEK